VFLSMNVERPKIVEEKSRCPNPAGARYKRPVKGRYSNKCRIRPAPKKGRCTEKGARALA
jgi:hypothetical protein